MWKLCIKLARLAYLILQCIPVSDIPLKAQITWQAFSYFSHEPLRAWSQNVNEWAQGSQDSCQYWWLKKWTWTLLAFNVHFHLRCCIMSCWPSERPVSALRRSISQASLTSWCRNATTLACSAPTAMRGWVVLERILSTLRHVFVTVHLQSQTPTQLPKFTSLNPSN